MKKRHVRNNNPKPRLEGQTPTIHIGQNLQTWMQMKECSLPDYIRLKAKHCIKKHDGKYYRLLLCGTGISSAVKRWYHADDPTKVTVAA